MNEGGVIMSFRSWLFGKPSEYFGRSIDDPIPVNSPLGQVAYLSRLLTETGEKVFFHRFGSINTVDVYELVSESGALWDVLYLDMYHKKQSNRAPYGYILQPSVGYIRGDHMYIEDFPASLYDVLRKSGGFPGHPVDPDCMKITGFKRPSWHVELLKGIQLHGRGYCMAVDKE